MDTDLQHVVAALGDLDDAELQALIATVNGVPQFAPGLLAWIEGACDWEVHRRRGLDFPLLPPEAAIDPSEDAVSIDAAVMLWERFAHDEGDRPAVSIRALIEPAIRGVMEPVQGVVFVISNG